MALNVLSWSLWDGAERHYLPACRRNYRLWEQSGLDRELWIYHDASVSRKFMQSCPRARWIEMPTGRFYHGAIWRYLAIDEADNVWMRDVEVPLYASDNRLLEELWMRTGARVAIFRDHRAAAEKPWARKLMNGGSWNIRGCMNGRMREMVTDYQKRYWAHPYGTDEYFLGRYVLPCFKDDCVVFIRRPMRDLAMTRKTLATHTFDGTHYRTHPATSVNVRFPSASLFDANSVEVSRRFFRLKSALRDLVSSLGRLRNILLTGGDRICVTRFDRALGRSWRLRYCRGLHNTLLALKAGFFLRRASVAAPRASAAVAALDEKRLCARLAVGVHVEEAWIANLHVSVYSILRQCPTRSDITLYIPQDTPVSHALQRLQAWGVSVERVASSEHSPRHTLSRLLTENADAVCVYSEAGIAYPLYWLAELCQTWYEHPRCVCAGDARVLHIHKAGTRHRPHYRSSDLVYGREILLDSLLPVLACGLLFPPGAGSCDIWKDKTYAGLAGPDDIWLKSALRAAGYDCYLVPELPHWPNHLDPRHRFKSSLPARSSETRVDQDECHSLFGYATAS